MNGAATAVPTDTSSAVDLYRVAAFLVRAKGVPRQDLDDVIADCVLAVIASTTYDPARGSFATFVFWTMRAVISKWWRSKQRRETPTLDAAIYDAGGDTFAAQLVDEQIGDVAEEISDRLLVENLLAQLPPKHRSLVVRRFFRDEGESTIAAALGVRSVRGLTGYALAKMRCTATVRGVA